MSRLQHLLLTRLTFAVLLLIATFLLTIPSVEIPNPASAQGSPFRAIQDGGKYFVQVDLRDNRVQPQVILANNNSGGYESLASMKTRFENQGYSEYVIVNGDVFGRYDESGNRCPSNVNCAQGLTYIDGQRRDNWDAYGNTWNGRGNIGFDSNNGVEIAVGNSQTKRHMTIAGGPRVVMSGRSTCAPQQVAGGKIWFPESNEFFDSDAARWCGSSNVTLVGFTADRSHLFIGVSTGGESIFQIADWLVQQGAVEVLRFDGGGSTGLYHNGTLHGSAGRTIPNALALVVTTSDSGDDNGSDPDPSTCPAPEPTAPEPGYNATSRQVTFRWNSVNCGHNNKYRLWIMRDGGGDIISPRLVDGTSTSVDIPEQYAGQLLYWRVGAEISGRRSSNWRPLRVGTPPAQTQIMPPHTTCLRPLLRYWNATLRKHFYTTSTTELGFGRDGWSFEGHEVHPLSGDQRV